MQVRRLSLTNFRNYSRLELDLPSGVILLHGDNAQGKTNLLEAIYFLATTRSPHTSQDQQLINWDALQADEPVVVGRLVADVVRPDTPAHLETVSYTHLDVYKRQGSCVGVIRYGRFIGGVQFQKIAVIEAVAQHRVCLLYTSRCV